MASLRVGIDGGALLRPETGIGRYTWFLIENLARELENEVGGELVVLLNEFRASQTELPSGVRRVNPGFPSRLLRLLWDSLGVAPADRLCGGLDVFHTSDWVHPPLKSAAAVTTVHDIGALVHPEWYSPDVAAIHEKKNSRAAERADAIIAISAFTRDAFLARFPMDESRIHVVHNGVSADFAPADADAIDGLRRAYDLPERFLLYVGTREPRKNLPGLIRIFEAVSEREPDVELVVVGLTGGGKERAVQGAEAWTGHPLEAARHPEALSPRVRVLGPVPRPDLIALYSAATALCFPTLYEGFGLPLLEAMACGCPVVSSNTTAVPEVVGPAAVLMDPEDEGAFAERVVELLRNGSELEALGWAGLERARTFTWGRTARETLSVYRRVAATGAP